MTSGDSTNTGGARSGRDWTTRLWGESASLGGLAAGGVVLLFAMLGAGELRSIEGRWAAVCSEMLLRKDYLHPYLFGAPYYDKPLLSYWLIIGCVRVLGELNEWALRLPSALAGLAAALATAALGRRLLGARAGLLAGWMLLTSFFFVDWSRTAAADMLNVAGTMLALHWYFARRDAPGFGTWCGLFAILALTSLTKGLIGAVLPALLLLPDLLRARRWRQLLTVRALLALAPAAAIYLAPFLASSATGESYAQSGLALVLRENVVRYFDPFDHRGPIYTYVIYLPLYLLPWSVFLVPAIASAARRWRVLDPSERWLALACLIGFAFLTASGSRRSYYVLPLLPPFALLQGWWLAARGERFGRAARWLVIAGAAIVLAWFGIAQPVLAHAGGLRAFGGDVRRAASALWPWPAWRVVFIDAAPKSSYYLRSQQIITSISLEDAPHRLPDLVRQFPATIVVSRRRSEKKVQALLGGWRIVVEPPDLAARQLGASDDEACVAFLPRALD
ncbi:MAG: glycosyltransferase family 39 protein [Planctomycetota bacterium]